MTTIKKMKLVTVAAIFGALTACQTEEIDQDSISEEGNSITEEQFNLAKQAIDKEYEQISNYELIQEIDNLGRKGPIFTPVFNPPIKHVKTNITLENFMTQSRLDNLRSGEAFEVPSNGEYAKYTLYHKNLFIAFLNKVGGSLDTKVLGVIQTLQKELPLHRSKLTPDGFKEMAMLYYGAEKAYYSYKNINRTPTLVKKEALSYGSKGPWPGNRFVSKWATCMGSKGKIIGRGIAGGAIAGAITGGIAGAAGGTVALPGVGTAGGAIGGAVFGGAFGAIRGAGLAILWSSADCSVNAALEPKRVAQMTGDLNKDWAILVEKYGIKKGSEIFEAKYKAFFQSQPPILVDPLYKFKCTSVFCNVVFTNRRGDSNI